jgi:hypothetical protein
LTLDAELNLGFTGDPGQWVLVGFCAWDADGAPEAGRMNHPIVAFTYPVGKVERQPGKAGFGSPFMVVPVDIPLQLNDTVRGRLTIQVRPDGYATLWLDGAQIARTPARIPRLDQPFRACVFGSSVGGAELYVTRLRVWSQQIY